MSVSNMNSFSIDSCSRVYASLALNRYSHAVDWLDGLIAFASYNTVAIFDPKIYKVIELLSGYKGNVRCVKWVQTNSLVTACCSLGSVIIWQKNEISYSKRLEWSEDSPCVALDSTLDSSGKILTVTSTRNFHLQIYRESERILSAEVGIYVLAVKLLISGPDTIVFYAGDDCVVKVASIAPNSQLNHLITLTGHTNWIKSIDIATEDDKILVVTGSQDNHARLWSLKKLYTENDQLSLEQRLETVLSGHEDSLTSARISQSKPRRILTASLDRSVILWSEPSDNESVWCESARVGEVGGNNPGFIGCTFDRSHEDTSFSAYSFNGALHIWQFDPAHSNRWQTQRTFGGHFEKVNSLSWEPTGSYLISASSDETTRIHLPFTEANSSSESWLEFARPQIHGYEINCVCAIDALTFVSGADEKVIRVFQATQDFVDRFSRVKGSRLSSTLERDKLSVNSVQPALGLTNRAIYGDEAGEGEIISMPIKSHTLPREEDLMQNTLFPEVAKLYGHGNEIFALAVNHKGTIMASSCKAAKQQEAGLILWTVGREFTILQKLDGHQLTVTAIKFSPDDRYILSVSRDRTLFLYALENGMYISKANTDKTSGVHKRIIWDAAWTPEGQHFCTVSRDKTAIMWQIDEGCNGSVSVKPVVDQILTLEHSIGCCDIPKRKLGTDHLIALGTEDGTLHLYSWSLSSSWSPLLIFKPHQSSVSRVAFRPIDTQNRILFIASASEDKSVQVHRITWQT